jgi:lipopolysaccharide export system protein LptA
MKPFLFIAGVVAFAALAAAQTSSVRITADTVHNGGRSSTRPIPGSSAVLVVAERTVILRGNVTLTTDTGVIRAEEAVVYPDTNKIELQGKVTVQLTAPPVISR